MHAHNREPSQISDNVAPQQIEITEVANGNNDHISKVQKFKSKKHEKHLSNYMVNEPNK